MFDFFRNRSERKRAELREGHRLVMTRQLADAGIRPDLFSKVIDELSYWQVNGSILQALAVNSAITKYACSALNVPHTPEEKIVHLVLQAVVDKIVFADSMSRGDLCGAVRDIMDAAAEDKERTTNLLTPKYDECNGFASEPRVPSEQSSLLDEGTICELRNNWCDNIDFDLYMALCTQALAAGEKVSIHCVEDFINDKSRGKRISSINTTYGSLWTEPKLVQQMERDTQPVRVSVAREQPRPDQLLGLVTERIQASEKRVMQVLMNLEEKLTGRATSIGSLEVSGVHSEEEAAALANFVRSTKP